MKKSSLLVIATVLLLATSSMTPAEEPSATASPDADCNRVLKAKAAADQSISPAHLARDLNLPVEKVNSCLLLLRRAGRPSTPKPVP